MAFVVVFDANVLYPIALCDLMITTLESQLYRAHWSTSILLEVERTYVRNFPDRSPENIRKRIQLMNVAEPGALVEPPPKLIEAMTNDPKDRHVLATAVAAGAEVLVTFNLDDFPEAAFSHTALSPNILTSSSSTSWTLILPRSHNPWSRWLAVGGIRRPRRRTSASILQRSTSQGPWPF